MSCTSTAARARSSGTRARRPATRRPSARCAWTATATRCSLSVEPAGPACHTGERTCFSPGDLEPPAPYEALAILERTLVERARDRPAGLVHRHAARGPAARGREGPRGGRGGHPRRPRGDRRARRQRGRRRPLPPRRAAARPRALADGRRRGAQWPSPLRIRPAARPRRWRSCRSSRASTRCASSPPTTTSSRCATRSSTTPRRRSARSSSCAAASRSSRRSCSSPPSAASRSGATRSSACARARSCAGRSATTRADPYGLAADEVGAFRQAPWPDMPPFAGGAVGFFGYDLVRTVEPLGEPNPDPVGLPDMALMLSDVLVVFDHLKHTISVLVNVYADDASTDLDAAYADAVATIAKARDLLAGPVPRPEPTPARPRPDVLLEHAARAVRGDGRADRRVRPRRRRVSGRAVPALVGRPRHRPVQRLPRPARREPEPVHVLPGLHGLPGRGRLARAAC